MGKKFSSQCVGENPFHRTIYKAFISSVQKVNQSKLAFKRQLHQSKNENYANKIVQNLLYHHTKLHKQFSQKFPHLNKHSEKPII